VQATEGLEQLVLSFLRELSSATSSGKDDSTTKKKPARKIVLELGLISRAEVALPEPERYGLTSQMRRAAASVPANIASGCGRAGQAELRQFLFNTIGKPDLSIST